MKERHKADHKTALKKPFKPPSRIRDADKYHGVRRSHRPNPLVKNTKSFTLVTPVAPNAQLCDGSNAVVSIKNLSWTHDHLDKRARLIAHTIDLTRRAVTIESSQSDHLLYQSILKWKHVSRQAACRIHQTIRSRLAGAGTGSQLSVNEIVRYDYNEPSDFGAYGQKTPDRSEYPMRSDALEGNLPPHPDDIERDLNAYGLPCNDQLGINYEAIGFDEEP